MEFFDDFFAAWQEHGAEPLKTLAKSNPRSGNPPQEETPYVGTGFLDYRCLKERSLDRLECALC
jgi:hypothetical protein